VQLHTPDEVKPEITTADNTLKIVSKSDDGFGINLAFNSENSLVLKVPAITFDKIDITALNASMRISDLNFVQADFHVDNGLLTARNLHGNALTTEFYTGNVTLEQVELATLNSTVNTGIFKGTNLTLTGAPEASKIDVNTGSITLDYVKLPNIAASTNTGSTHVNGEHITDNLYTNTPAAAGKMVIHTNTGNVKITNLN
jgi:DUF4097 and DUF4098 domain-containing protein YvlB